MGFSRAGRIANRVNQMPDNRQPEPLPWSFPVTVSRLPETGLHVEFEASAAERAQLAAVAGLNAVLLAKASFDLAPAFGSRIDVSGRVHARVGQTCVASLDPMESDIDEAIAVVFAPPEQIPVSVRPVQKEEGEDAEIPDPPEPIVNGVIDLGHLAAEFLMLGVDPYPRKPGAMFAAPAEAPDPEDHPFAALKALKEQNGGSGGET
jgi:uncharacterized metal-binding protein YceD (DUF177 family)